MLKLPVLMGMHISNLNFASKLMLYSETNLKMREALQDTAGLTNRPTIAKFEASIEAEPPNDLISVFRGNC